MLTFLTAAPITGSQGTIRDRDPFFTLSLDMLCVMGGDGYFLEINPRWEETLGFTEAQLLAQPWINLIHPQDQDLTLTKLYQFATTTAPVSFKNRCRCADGSYKWLLWHVSLNSGSQLLYAVVRDLTEGKESKKALWDSEERFHCLVENVKDYAIYMLDLDGYIVSWNQGAKRINGYEEDEIIGKHVSCFYPPEDVESGKPDKVLKEAAQVGRFEDESYRIRRDGSRFWVNAVITALRDKNGRVRGFAKVVRDITERKLAQEALQQERDNLEKRVAQRTGELLEKNKQLIREIKERKYAEKELKSREAQLREQTRQLQETLQKLQQTQVQLIQSEKMSSLGQLVAGIAHEINNPVTFIHGNLNYAQQYFEDLLNLLKLYHDYYPQPPEEIASKRERIEFDFITSDLPKLINSMQVGANRIYEIVRSLRNFSHLDRSGKKPVDLHEGIDNTLLILQNRLKPQKNHSPIETIKNYGNLPLVECYAGELNQVFMNIISNGIDAVEEIGCESLEVSGDEAQQKISPQIRIRTEVINENWVGIYIADNGIGMTESVKKRLFDPFFTTKPVGKGTGLGLSISYQIVVEKHGGHLKCFSEPNRGTEFVIEIPVKQEFPDCYCPNPAQNQGGRGNGIADIAIAEVSTPDWQDPN